MSEENKTQDDISQDISNGFSDENSTLFGEKTAKKPIKTKKNKLALRVIIPIIVLAILAGTVFALTKLVPETPVETETTSVPALTVTLFSAASADIVSMRVTNQSGSYLMFSTPAASEEEDALWSIEGIDSKYTNAQIISGTVEDFSTVIASRKIEENAQDFAQYGLDKTYASLEILAHDTSRNFKLELGDEDPTGDGRYAKVNGSNDVYLINSSTVKSIERDTNSFISIFMLDAVAKSDDNEQFFDNDGALIGFDEITITSNKNAAPIVLKINPYKGISSIPYIMSAPVKQSVMGEAGDAVKAPMKTGLAANGAYAYMPTPEQLKYYSMDKPEVVVNYTIGNLKVTLKISADPDDSQYYAVMVDDKPVIYQIVKTQLPFAAYTTEQYFNSYIFLDDITAVKTVTAVTENGAHVYELTHSKDEKDLDVLEVRSAGNTLDAQNFRYLYQYMMSCTAMEFTMDKAPEGTPASLTLKVEYLDTTREPLEVSYVKTADRRYHVSVNGVPLGHAYQNTVDNLISYDDSYFAGGEVPKP